ncbi:MULTISPECIES: glycerophosphodiester phosphodiesterase [Aerococcus]|uniref:Glycerophosphodiester phosphodiesterase n=1 Tax=Aerococcus sanguinicola TaxID=119206 RepID=A0A5N1GLP7_9LACT|nr:MULTISPECIES: glycerophosphodiester phosphodiesterase [Aerococcus]KAA9301702.1 glycerophosphodiester phosphodiesterase [Aerococcus sanguinicola]MDK6368885.1 glycerophosphodiester phosphodiesterase [Aerococcus sp. UMB9870]MDK6685672.1 glycerophosphodiester phosphodiesterase [Aerococcus sp. UMB8623]OFK19579.1 hypothetical protein HMPREF2829_00345 [Aerococcus sp. HMSC072A12]OFR32742.1 hypothetical protein HMPREF2892_06990 [Aerococcus sp. HMSC061A03]
MQILAHRGYSSKYPENTMLAFREAYAAGADGLELDVQLSRDGQVVVCHDERIDRTSNASGRIMDYSLAELKSFDFSNGFASIGPSEDLQIPTLEEVLQWLQGNHMVLNIELKTNQYAYPGLAEKVVDLVQQYKCAPRVLISSFNHYSIQEVKALAPDLACAFLEVNSLISPGLYCQAHGVDYYHPHFFAINDTMLENLHDKGIKVNVWTVDGLNLASDLMDKGINGLITNDPASLRALLNSRKIELAI